MPISKNNGTAVETGPLVTAPIIENQVEKKGRDFDAEARGKVGCVAYGDALKSPGLTMLPFSTLEEYLRNVERAADAMVEYTWRKQRGE